MQLYLVAAITTLLLTATARPVPQGPTQNAAAAGRIASVSDTSSTTYGIPGSQSSKGSATDQKGSKPESAYERCVAALMKNIFGDNADSFGLGGQRGTKSEANTVGVANGKADKVSSMDEKDHEAIKEQEEAVARLVATYCGSLTEKSTKTTTPDGPIKPYDGVDIGSSRPNTAPRQPSIYSNVRAFNPAEYSPSTRISFPKFAVPNFGPLPAGLMRWLPNLDMSSTQLN